MAPPPSTNDPTNDPTSTNAPPTATRRSRPAPRSLRERAQRAVYQFPRSQDTDLQSSPSSPSSDSGDWYLVDEILDERRTRYRVSWIGRDPRTGQRWKPEWIRKSDVTAAVKAAWNEKKKTKRRAKSSRRKKARPAERASKAARAPRRASAPASVPQPEPDADGAPCTEPESTDASEYQPTQAAPAPSTVSSYGGLPSHERGASQHVAGQHGLELRDFGVVIEPRRNFDRKDYLRFSETPETPRARCDGRAAPSPAREHRIRKLPAAADEPALRAQRPQVFDDRVIPDSQSFGDTTITSLDPATGTPPGSPLLGDVQRAPSATSEESAAFQDAAEYVERPPEQAFHEGEIRESQARTEGVEPEDSRTEETPPPTYEESIAQSSNSTNRPLPGNPVEQSTQSNPLGSSQSVTQESKKSDILDLGSQPAQRVSHPPVELDSVESSILEFVSQPAKSSLAIFTSSHLTEATSGQLADWIDQSSIDEEAISTQQAEDPGESAPSPSQESHARNVVGIDAENDTASASLAQPLGQPEESKANIGTDTGDQEVSKQRYSFAQRLRAISSGPPRAELSDWFGLPGEPASGLRMSGQMSDGSEFRQPATPGSAAQSRQEKLDARFKMMQDRIAQRRSASIHSPRATPQPDVTRSPSVIPPTTQSPIVTHPHPPLDEKPQPSGAQSQPSSSSQVVPSQPLVPQPLPSTPQNAVQHTVAADRTPQSQVSVVSNFTRDYIRSPGLGQAEYALGLPMSTDSLVAAPANQKQAYYSTLMNKHAAIDRYLSAPDSADQALKKEMFDLLSSLNKISTHPNLVYDTEQNPNVPASRRVEYDVVLSSKFKFIRDFLNAVKESSVKIAIVAESNVLIDMLEVFLRGLRILHKRLDKMSTLPHIPDDEIEGMAQVILMPSTPKSGVVGSSCDIVIAMDSTFSTDSDEVQQIRSSMLDPGKLAPVVRLVALNTMEHVALCRDPASNEDAFLHAAVEAVTILRQDAGVQDATYAAKVGDAAAKIGAWVRRKCVGSLELPSLPEMPLFEASTQLSQIDERAEVHIDLTGDEPPTEKRKREDTEQQPASIPSDVHDAKKQKLSEEEHWVPPLSAGTVNNKNVDFSHVSESVPGSGNEPAPQSSAPIQTEGEEPPSTLGEGPMDLDDDDESTEEEDFDVVFVQPKSAPGTTKLESLSQPELLLLYQDAEKQLNSFVDCTGRLQERFEQMQVSHRELKRDLKTKERALETAMARRDRALKDLAVLGERNLELGAQLDEAKRRLVAGPPDTAQLERMRAENEATTKKLSAAQARIEATEQEAQFARDEYQKASNATYEMRKELNELARSNEDLQRRADERVLALRRQHQGDAIAARDREIHELRLRLKDQADRIAKLEHEKANPRPRGALGTRSTSVPRRGSPAQSRASSPTAMAGAGGASPAAAAGHPLRHHAAG